jgi:hypothetical protein
MDNPNEMLAVTGRMISRRELEAQAVDFAEAATAAGKDWQEIQCDLLNGRYAPLFASAIGDGEITDEDADYTMRIIRQAEERVHG